MLHILSLLVLLCLVLKVEAKGRGGGRGNGVPLFFCLREGRCSGLEVFILHALFTLTSSLSSFFSKCGVASVTVTNVAAEGERRRWINLREFESSTRGKKKAAEENFQATGDLIILGTLCRCLRNFDGGSEEETVCTKKRTFKQRIM